MTHPNWISGRVWRTLGQYERAPRKAARDSLLQAALRVRDRSMGMASVNSGFNRSLAAVLALLATTAGAAATPSLVADLVTGEVIAQEDATRPWYPASLTKLMTV